MEYHSKIKLFHHPKLWFKDKYKTGLNRKDLLFVAILPPVLGGLAFIADLIAVFGIHEDFTRDTIILTLIWFLFIFAALNMLFILLLQRNGMRLERERENYSTLHKNVIEEMREYCAKRRHQTEKLDSKDIKNEITHMLEKFNDNYMKKIHSPDVSAIIKYKNDKLLYPIRVGFDKDTRCWDPEPVESSHVYKKLDEPGKKLRYIYVKDLNDPDKYEREVIGNSRKEIQNRAKGHYNTFIAMPIRAGKLANITDEFVTRPDLGMIGFDLKEKFGFGNFEDHEINFIACFADIMSEPLQDLIESMDKK